MKRRVRILLTGDSGVGKSSIINTLVKEKFEENVELVVPEVTIPPDMTPENVTTHICDTSSKPEDREQLEAEVRMASVICLVYDVSDPESLKRVASHWLPFLRKVEGSGNTTADSKFLPVILVGNKIDLSREANDAATKKKLEQTIMPIMVQSPEVETCVECSAKEVTNISEVFYFAQKAVLHPTAPLYDSQKSQLKPECVKALSRIFALSDTDRDGLLSDEELSAFQQKCYAQPLQKKELEGIKDVVQKGCSEGIDPNQNMLTVSGFLYLHLLFVQRGRLETTWIALREYGYGDDLQLTDDFLYPPFKVGNDQTVELSAKGMRAIYDLFMASDKDKDSALSPSELENLFSTAISFPWPENFTDGTATNSKGYVTLDGYLAQWVLFTLQAPREAVACLRSLGCVDQEKVTGQQPKVPSIVRVTTSKRTELRRGHTSRTVFRCFVMGAKGSGKSSLLRALTRKEPRLLDTYVSTTQEQTAVGPVSMDGSEKYLVIKEIPANGKDAEVLRNTKRMHDCDLVVFLYDNSDPQSFCYVAELQRSMPADTSVIFVATKNELPEAEQCYDVQPEEYTRMLGLQPPPRLVLGKEDDVLGCLVESAMNPQMNIPAGDERDDLGLGTWMLWGSVLLAAGLLAFYGLQKARR